MKYLDHVFRRPGIWQAAGLAASLLLVGEAQAQTIGFTGPGIYTIRIAGTNQVLDIDSRWARGGDAGQRLLRWGSNNGANQRFIILADGDGYIIRPMHSLLCLDLPYNSHDPGTEIQQLGCNGSSAQRFYINSSGADIAFIFADNGNESIVHAPTEGQKVVLGSWQSGTPDTAGTAFEFLRL